MKRTPEFETEAQLCAAFAAWAKTQGFTVYPETEEWDLLCVTSDGLQLGVEAKLSLNAKVVTQALRGAACAWGEHRGPDYRAILVPSIGDSHFANALTAFVGLAVLFPEHVYRYAGEQRAHFARVGAHEFELHDWNPRKRCELPAYIPDVPAGVPAPRTLSPWKIGALRVMALLELQGYVTRDDIRNCKIDPRRWCGTDHWLIADAEGRWLLSKAPRFDQQHPDVYAQILNETRSKILRPRLEHSNA